MRVSPNLTGSLGPIVARVRRMFDLGADPEIISERLGQDPALRPFLAAYPGLRLPGAWDGFEMAVRAILGQQVSITAAATLAGRLAQDFGDPFGDPMNETNPVGINRLFPRPETLANASLAAPGMPAKRWEAIRGLAAAAVDGRLEFLADRSLDDLVGSLVQRPGIGPWTAHYVALRLGQPDAFPGGDLALRRAASELDGVSYSEKTLTARSAGWRPWRSYAAMYLWRRYYPATVFP
jgi:AraC family transcriptional regulator of adaptative response / DNA-3-methyladenine glycosylase II